MAERKMIYLDDAINTLECKKDKKANGYIGGFYNKIIQNDIDALMQLPSAQSEFTNEEIRFTLKQLKVYFAIKIRDRKDGSVPFDLLQCVEEIQKYFENVSFAQPERVRGRWHKISPAGIYECSVCGQNVMTNDIAIYKFCHGCGADMRNGNVDENIRIISRSRIGDS